MSARHLVALLTLATLAAAPARGQILYSYGGPPGNGPVDPSGDVIEGANGVLYGTAYGMPDDRTERSAYSLTPVPGGGTYTVSILHTGDQVVGSLLLAPGGGLYGFSPYGGPNNAGYFYTLTPAQPPQTVWPESILFDIPATNGTPTTGPIAGPGGSIFGDGSLSVFQLFPPASGQTSWTEQTVYTFPASLTNTSSSFIYAPSGVLYGSLSYAGSSRYGQIIALTPPAIGQTTWTESVLYSFTNGTDGNSPGRLVIDAAGTLYGVAQGGTKGEGSCCGIVFKLAPPAQQGAAWSFALLHTFANSPDGSFPEGVVLDRHGNLFGGTESGGLCCGIMFKLTRPGPGQTAWVETVAARPSKREGASLTASFIGTDRRLYGRAGSGGEFGMGEVFALPQNLK